jgi:hypothetical protein
MLSAMAAPARENTLKKSCAAGSGKLMNDPNLDQLIAAARLLRPLLNDLVFVGGCVTGLLITDAAAGAPRSTLDGRRRPHLLPDAASQSRIGIVLNRLEALTSIRERS